ncbi:endonuclease domain-containing protein [Methylomagnum sp.]
MQGEVLVAIMNNGKDFRILCEESWYRIPVDSVERWLKHRWPPRWVAFYQTKAFKGEAYSVRYYAKVHSIKKVHRHDLFPNEPPSPKQDKTYYKISLGPLQTLPKPILSRRWRRIIFIPSTWEKFINAAEINDLYDDSPLEDRMWTEFKRLQIDAERQELVEVDKKNYLLDFAVYCVAGKLDVETDGDSWHVGKEKAGADNLRDNALKTEGWRVLRFNTLQVNEKMAGYCVPTVVENINRLGGLERGDEGAKKIRLDDKPGQLELF